MMKLKNVVKKAKVYTGEQMRNKMSFINDAEMYRAIVYRNYHLEDCRKCSSGTIFFDGEDGVVLSRSEASRLRDENYERLNEVECESCCGTGKSIVFDIRA